MQSEKIGLTNGNCMEELRKRELSTNSRRDKDGSDTKGFTNGLRKGLTNGSGKGFTNGACRGFTNGYQSGLTNGADKGFINGCASEDVRKAMTTPYGVLLKKTKESRLKTAYHRMSVHPHARATLALLSIIVIMAVVPQAAYQFITNIDKINIDGIFDDWNNVAKTSDRLNDVAQKEIDISSVATVSQNDRAFIYLSSNNNAAQMFKGKETDTAFIMDTIVIFVDTDKNPATGYETSSGNGADWMLQVGGYNYAVKRAITYEFDGASDSNDWSGWANKGSIRFETVGNQIEMKAEGLNIDESIIELYFVSVEGDYDALDVSIVNTDGKVLDARASSVETPTPIVNGETSLFNLELRARNGDVRVSSITVKVEGSIGDVEFSPRIFYRGDGNGGSIWDIVRRGTATLPCALTLYEGQSTNVTIGINATGSRYFGKTVRLSLSAIRSDATTVIDAMKMSRSYSYIGCYDEQIEIDGGFMDWESKRPIAKGDYRGNNPDIEIHEIKATDGYAYVSTFGNALGGAMIFLNDVAVLKEKPLAQDNSTITTSDNTTNTTAEIRQNVSKLTNSIMDTLVCTFDGMDMVVIEGINNEVKSAKHYQMQGKSWVFMQYVKTYIAKGEIEFVLPRTWTTMRVDIFDYAKRGDAFTLSYEKSLPEGVFATTPTVENPTSGNATPIPTSQPEPPTTDALTDFTLVVDGYNQTQFYRFGWNVSAGYDINNDAISDLIVGAPYLNYSGRTECGAVFIFFGYYGLANILNKYSNTSSANTTIYGSASNAHFGFSLAGIGDIDKDNYDDIVVGAPDTTNGNAYIFYGKGITWRSQQSDKTWDLNSVMANVTMTGAASGDQFGYSVAGAGDYNGDTYMDVVVGAPSNDTFAWEGVDTNNDRGAVYVLNGSVALSATYAATSMNQTWYSPDANFRLGSAVSSAGDFDSDGNSNIVAGATKSNTNTGVVYLIGINGTIAQNRYNCSFENSGGINNNGWYSTGTVAISSTTVHSGTYSARISGSSTMEKYFSFDDFFAKELRFWWRDGTIVAGQSGYLDINDGVLHTQVASVGDGEGWNEEIIDLTRFNASELQVSFYHTDLGSRYIYVDDFNITGVKVIKNIGENTTNYFGCSIANMSDVNGDSKPEIVIGAGGYNSNQGRVYIMQGSNFTQPSMRTNYYYGFEVFNGAEQAQAFMVNTPIQLWAVAIWVWDLGTDSTQLIVNVQTDNAGKPSGTKITENRSMDFSSSGEWKRIQFNMSPNLTAMTKYWIVVNDSVGTSGNGYAWLFDRNDPYVNGGQNQRVGASWNTESTDYDLCFTIYAKPNATITGEASGDEFGFSVSASNGDITGDGKPDIIVGAPYYAPYYNGNDYGAVYVLNGTLNEVTTATTAMYRNVGTQANMRPGFSVAGLGDLNSDGNWDLVVGAPYYDWSGNVDSGYVGVMSVAIPEFSPIFGITIIIIALMALVGRTKRKRGVGSGECQKERNS